MKSKTAWNQSGFLLGLIKSIRWELSRSKKYWNSIQKNDRIKNMDDKELMKILKAVANENRFAILKCLYKDKELSVGDLAEENDLPFRSVSRDLFVLRKANLVQTRNHFSERLYSINILNFPKELLIFFKS